MKQITYVSHQSYLFKGTVRDNLRMGKPDAEDSELWEVLERANLAAFLKKERGLDTGISEKGGNLSGGQCQRLALAEECVKQNTVTRKNGTVGRMGRAIPSMLLFAESELGKGSTFTVRLPAHGKNSKGDREEQEKEKWL